MQKVLAALVLGFVLSTSLSAQVLMVKFKDSQAASRTYKKWVVKVDDEFVLLGEMVPGGGIRLTPGGGGLTYISNAENRLVVLDPSDPLAVPYELEGRDPRYPAQDEEARRLDRRRNHQACRLPHA